MFNFGSKVWPGVAKLVEEAGEVVQVCGKLMGTGGDVNYWGGINLKDKMEEELADLMAAISFVIQRNGLNLKSIDARASMKVALFAEWSKEERVKASPVFAKARALEVLRDWGMALPTDMWTEDFKAQMSKLTKAIAEGVL